MSEVTEAGIRRALGEIGYSSFGSSYIEMEAIESINIGESGVDLYLKVGLQMQSKSNLLAMTLSNELEKAGIPGVTVHINSEVFASPLIARQGHLKDVKNIVMVASGKGGVGKSTTSVNLALALQAEGAKVGILDADIYGPSLRTMLGIDNHIKPELVDQKYVSPVRKYGLKSMSVAFMSEDKTPMIWRGPMAVRALQQLLENTLWGDLDYLIIDMPPGTGDIHISLAQKVNVSGAIVVTTPQEMAVIDARKGLEMFNKVSIPVLGIVENMATHRCSNCGFEETVFGSGGAQHLADSYQVQLLGTLPLDKQIRADVDSGSPTVVESPGSTLAQSYIALAHQVGIEVWKTNRRGAAAPEIQIVDSLQIK